MTLWPTAVILALLLMVLIDDYRYGPPPGDG